MEKIIIGAGLAGLIAACHFKDAKIQEAGPGIEGHKALLRFRDKSVSNLTGIPFREVSVNKALYSSDEHRLYDRCDIRMANLYSRKVTGRIANRSVWDLSTVTRYVAPEDFYGQLLKRHESRVQFHSPVSFIGRHQNKAQYISTAPIGIMAGIAADFTMRGDIQTRTDKSGIVVERYRVKNCDVHQTIYFFEEDLRIFRASITGDVLIAEYMPDTNGVPKKFSVAGEFQHTALPAFGLTMADVEYEETVDQRYGKIVDLPKDIREAALYELTRDYSVYSLGRFATWRNILLDDVAKDILKIEALMNASDYGRLKARAFDDHIPF